MKKSIILLALSVFLLGADVKSPWEKIAVLDKEIPLQSEVHGVSVSADDEIAIDFNDGTVYLYDCNRKFLLGYKFPRFSPQTYNISFDEEQNLINHFVPNGKELYTYNREGKLLSKKTINSKEMHYYSASNELHRTDSNGVVYKKEKGDIVRIYPDGTSEIFFEGYKAPQNDFLPALSFVLILIIIMASIYRKMRVSSLEFRRLK